MLEKLLENFESFWKQQKDVNFNKNLLRDRILKKILKKNQNFNLREIVSFEWN